MAHILCFNCFNGYDSELGCRCQGGSSPDDHLNSLAMIPSKPVEIPEEHQPTPLFTWRWRGETYGLFSWLWDE
jgi:hypothetical protein